MTIPTWPSFTEEEVQAVSEVLASNRVNYWTGDIGRTFEHEFARWAGSRHAIALANGTLALDLALAGLAIGAANGGSREDEVIVTPRTFIASISTVVLAGATPVFADVEPDSGNISAATIAPLLTERTKAVIPVHLGGWPVDMGPMMALAREGQFSVIEDCAQAHGAKVDGRSVGSIGHVGAWSFCQDKIMTTGGEGGMVTTDNEALWSRMWSYKDHGKDWDAVYHRVHPPGFRFVHESFGTNWRMLEMQAAIGRIQLRRMAGWTSARTNAARRLRAALQPFAQAVRQPAPRDGLVHAYYRYYAYFRPEGLKSNWSRDRVIAALQGQGVPVMHGTCSEVYLEKAFAGTGFVPSKHLPIARELGKTSIMFLIHPGLEEHHLDHICSAIAHVFSDAAR